MKKSIIVVLVLCCLLCEKSIAQNDQKKILVGAEKTAVYFPWLKDKAIALVVNNTSQIGGKALVDSLLLSGFSVKKIFSPEHGYHGNKEAGEQIADGQDKHSGVQIISLYGKKKKPSAGDFKGIDVVVFDVQDVGVRFYTYLSTLHYVMEACAENNVALIILDRPNPNGFYVDGPVLENSASSFVGIAPIPIVHGLTFAEYAFMANEEGWLAGKEKCKFQYVTVDGYTHKYFYQLPANPSPNLTAMRAVYLYPSLALFEGTVMSMGRGTEFAFQAIGHPALKKMPFFFVPKDMLGSSINPLYEGQKCYGMDLRSISIDSLTLKGRINLSWLIDMYKTFPDQSKFFIPYFDQLAGNKKLRQQIIEGFSEEKIRKSWRKDLKRYKKVRKKYLLYPDFE